MSAPGRCVRTARPVCVRTGTRRAVQNARAHFRAEPTRACDAQNTRAPRAVRSVQDGSGHARTGSVQVKIHRRVKKNHGARAVQAASARASPVLDKQLARVMKPRAKRFAVWLRARLSEVDCTEFAPHVRRTRSWRFAACPTTAAHGIEHHRCIKLGASPADPGIGRAKERRGRGRTGRPRQKARVLAYCSECHARCVS